MFSFFFKIFFSFIIILSVYTLFKKNKIEILECLILLFIFQLCLYSFILNINIVNVFFGSILIISIYYLYTFLENKELNKKIPKQNILINRGIINFHELIKIGYTYNELIYNLKKHGINNPNNIDYCIKHNNDLIIFEKNSIRNYPISLIIDGKILKDNLFSLKKTIGWLDKKLEDNNINIKDVNYAYYKENQVYFVTN